MLTKSVLRAAVVALGLCVTAGPLQAQGTQPVRIVVPFNPGGGSDLFARLVSPGLSNALKETVIVENRAGAGGIIGTDAVVKSKPDQRMLLVSDSAAYTIVPSLYPNLPYQRKDLVPVANLAKFGNVLVVPANSRFKSFKDVLAEARSKPGTITIGSAGTGSITHLTAEKLMAAADIKLINVPYKGSGPAIADTAGGHVDMIFTGLPSVLELLRAGKLKALAIATLERSPNLPDTPTISESGLPGFASFISQGLFAPAALPPAEVERLSATVLELMRTPEMKDSMQKMMVDPVYETSAEYKKWLDDESAAWAALIKQANVKVE